MITLLSLNSCVNRWLKGKENLGYLCVFISLGSAAIGGLSLIYLPSDCAWASFGAIFAIDSVFFYCRKRKKPLRVTLPSISAPPFPAPETTLSFLKSKYDKKNPTEKADLHARFIADFPDSQGNREPLDGFRFHGTASIISDELLKNYPTDYVFGLGESPAWFLAIKQMKLRDPSRLRNIAFSRDWFGIIDQSEREYTVNYAGNDDRRKGINLSTIPKGQKLVRVDKSAPTDLQKTNYRRFLTSIGCHPKYIMDRKERTVFIDYVQRGGGLRSFLEVLIDWAVDEGYSAEAFKQKLVINFLYAEHLAVQLCGSDEDYRAYLADNFSHLAGTLDYTPMNQGQYLDMARLFTKTKDNEKRRLIRPLPCRDWDSSLRGSFMPITEGLELVFSELLYQIEHPMIHSEV